MDTYFKTLAYWRDSIVSGDTMWIDIRKFEERLRISPTELQHGKIYCPKAMEIFRSVRKNNEDVVSLYGVPEDHFELLTGSLLLEDSGDAEEDADLFFEDESDWPKGPAPLEVDVFPIRARAKFPNGKGINGYIDIIPICIPARLQYNGILVPSEDLPWIPREILEPTVESRITIGTVAAVDEFIALNGSRPRRNWPEAYQFAMDMLAAVTGQTSNSFAVQGDGVVSYVTDHKGYIIPQSKSKKASDSIVGLYDCILGDKKVVPLLDSFTSLKPATLIPLMDETASTAASKKHVGQMNFEFPLSASQRETLLHFYSAASPEILAVNGPPGTGKTTLLQSIVASLWVQAALENDAQPPLIVAASTNNKAVTNIIDSFGKVKTDGSVLSERWLPEITSYGLYGVSKSGEIEAAKDFQTIDSFHLAKTSDAYRFMAKEYFFKKFQQHTGTAGKGTREICRALQDELTATVSSMREGIELHSRLQTIRKQVRSFDKVGGIESFLQTKLKAVTTKKKLWEICKDLEAQWAQHVSTEPAMVTFLAKTLESGKNKVATRNNAFIKTFEAAHKINFSLKSELSDNVSIEREIAATTKKQLDGIEAAKRDVSGTQKIIQVWKGLEESFDQWLTQHNLSKETDLQEQLDTTFRYRAFLLATHYWEGRFIVECEERRSRKESQTSVFLLQKFRRLAKLTPCLVSTFHTLPRTYMAYVGDKNNHGRVIPVPLYGEIDLLIVDEAGQVQPEIGGASFALAKRALVVGDIWQLQPVTKIPPHADRANLCRHSLATKEESLEQISERGISVSLGSIMLRAQQQCPYQKLQEPGSPRGMMLTEHRRCVPEIIGFCNQIIYQGRLEAQRESMTDFFLPPRGYAHVPGDSKKMGSSFINLNEAQAIANWIEDNREKILAAYNRPDGNIWEFVGVITPFAPQSYKIIDELKKRGLQKVPCGTVHKFQGAECNIIIFSAVYGPSHQDKQFFFDVDQYLLNVAVSRAKDSFLWFGNMDVFKKSSTTEHSGMLLAPTLAKPETELKDIRL